MEHLILVFVVLIGLVLGSFFNVLILRLPENTLLTNKRSKCPNCNHIIRFYDNIPVLSYIILKGRCRDCNKHISLQYPIVELATAILATILFLFQEWPINDTQLIIWQAGVSFIQLFLIPLTLIDFRHRIIPDSISLGGLCFALVLALLPGGMLFKDAFLGALCGGGILFVIAYIGEKIFKKEAMGGGDIKLMAMAGAILGINHVLMAFFIGSIIGSIVGIIIKIRTKRSDLAFGPALSAGIIISFLFGTRILDWYWSLLM